MGDTYSVAGLTSAICRVHFAGL